MLDPSFIRQNPDLVREAITNKRMGSPSLVDEVLDLDSKWRTGVTELQELQSRSNALAREIGELMRTGKKDEAQSIIAENGRLKARTKELESEVRTRESALEEKLLEIPNVPHPSVPVGATAEHNVVESEHGATPEFAFEPKPHWDLLETTGFVDFERGAKVTGGGFPFYVGPVARLQRSLINYFLDTAAARGYVELQSPTVVNEDSARGTGQLPDKEDQMYSSPRDGLFLIPTAEVPVTNFHRGEILDADLLPVKYAAYTPCFRREAGSYGKDVRGLNRLHQFDKVELVQFVAPEDSYDALESLREDAEFLLAELGLPYRRLLMCTGDMGFTQAKKYDLEVFSAGQQRWLEVSSVSNFEAFQARRMKIRMRAADSAPRLLHTLNGSGLALPRVVAALLENGQQADGSIRIPGPLVRYFGGEKIEGHG